MIPDEVLWTLITVKVPTDDVISRLAEFSARDDRCRLVRTPHSLPVAPERI